MLPVLCQGRYAALTFLAQGIKAWLAAQLPKYAVVHPVQTSCLKKAVKFLPELERGLVVIAAARDFGDDEELEEGTPRTSATGSAAPTPPPPDF